MIRTAALALALSIGIFAHAAGQDIPAGAGDVRHQPIGSLSCRAGHTSLGSESAPAAGVTCLLTFDDDSPPLQFQGELHHPGFDRSGTGDRIIAWRVFAEGGHMPVSAVAGEYEVKPGGNEGGRSDVLVGGAQDAIALEPSGPGLTFVEADTRLTLRMMLQWSRTAAMGRAHWNLQKTQ